MAPAEATWQGGGMLRRLVAISLLALGFVTLDGCSGEPEPEAAATASLRGAARNGACGDLLAGVTGELPVTAGWREELVAFGTAELRHPAWGLAHAKRNFLLAKRLAEREGMTVDEDVLFAAAFLHDLGGLAGHEVEGVDHAVRSAELAPAILEARGFPAAKIPAVQQVILAHPYYNPTAPTSPEAIVFRDADVLDFLGAVGFARLAAVTERDAPNLAAAVALSRQLQTQLPPKLITNTAKCDGARRVALLDQIHQTIRLETFGGAHF